MRIRIDQVWKDVEGNYWRVVGLKTEVWLSGPLPLRGLKTVTRDHLTMHYDYQPNYPLP